MQMVLVELKINNKIIYIYIHQTLILLIICGGGGGGAGADVCCVGCT